MRMSCSAHIDAGVTPGSAVLPIAIERIVFLGLPTAHAWAVKLEGGGPDLVLERGPVNQAHAPGEIHAHVLRKPSLPVGIDWVFEVVPAATASS